MSDSIDLSELQSLSFRPDWVDKSKPADAAPASDVVWNFADKGGGGRGAGRGDRGDRQDRGDRGDRRGGGGGPGGGGGRNFDNRGGQGRGPGGGGGAGGAPGQRREGGNRPPGGGGGGGGGGGFSGPKPGGQANRPFADRGPRPAGDRPQGDRPQGDRPPRRDGGAPDSRGPRPDRPDRRDGGGNRGPRRDGGGGQDRRDRRPDYQEEERPRLAQGWWARILPEPRAVEALAKQIKASGRAYSVFDVAKLFLSARDRYLVHFFYKDPTPSARANPANAANAAETVAAVPPAVPELIQCTLDNSLWLTKEEALRHIRQGAAMSELYTEETVAIDPPKGNFTAIAVCGFSGTLLGPPNHHSFPVNVARLHREQFSNLALDYYKSRVRVEKGEEIVAKWLEQQSTERQYVCTKVAEGEEAPRFKTVAERDAHFLKNFADDSLKTVREITVMGNIPGKLLSPGLLSLLRVELDSQIRFPMNLVQELCRELENHGLRFFKRDKKTTFVCRSRPQFIGDNVPLSDRVRSIIEMVRANSGIGYGKIVGVLAPPAPEPEPVPVAEGETPAPPVPVLSTGELAIMQDIKWLVQEGFLTEFANGELHILGREHRERKPGAEGKPSAEKSPEPSTEAEAETPATSESPVVEQSAEALEAAEVVETVESAEATVEAEAEVASVETAPELGNEPVAEPAAEAPISVEPTSEVPVATPSEPSAEEAIAEPAAVASSESPAVAPSESP
jgi:hypothetical protein